MTIFLNKIVFRYIFQFHTPLNSIYAQYRLMDYQDYKNKDKEVRAMEGITKIEIPEIEGLRETFAESTVGCGEPGPVPHGC